MPKKRLNRTLQSKPNSSAPAVLAASTISISTHSRCAAVSRSTPSSVNELIHHLRQSQVGDEQLHRIPHTPTATTVHPSLRSLLSVPETPPPQPRPGSNLGRLSGPIRVRRIPGPPPPASWLGPSRLAKTAEDSTILTTRRMEQSSKLPGGCFPIEGSLQHTALKAVATNLHWLSQYESVHFLPTQLKQSILSYIAIYHEHPKPSQYKPSNPFRLLFPKFGAGHALVDASINDESEVSRLDLGGAIGWWLSMKELKEAFYAPKFKAVTEDPKILSESWDEECEIYGKGNGLTGEAKIEADALAALNVAGGVRATGRGDGFGSESDCFATTTGTEARNDSASRPPRTLESVSLRFSNLVHLSLALSPATTSIRKRTAASWSDLLKLAPSLSRLLSFSLAHWPSPTLTPHAASTYMTIKNPLSANLPSIPYGGSDMYTSYDGDWKEAANLLKILSRHLYCLQWLDLTGCGEWFAALSAPNSADWTGSWRGVEYVGLGVGWLPDLVEDVNESAHPLNHNLSTSPIPNSDAAQVRRFDYNHTSRRMLGVVHNDNEVLENERKKYFHKKAVEKYIEIVSTSHSVATSIHAARKGMGRWIYFDLSPELPHMRHD